MDVVLGLLCAVVWLAFFGILIGSVWTLFAKAGRPGWAALVPLYNLIVFLDIIGKPAWHFIFFLIPFVSIYFMIVYTIEFAHRYSASTPFAIGLIFAGPIFYPLLAWGDYPYQEARQLKRRRREYDEDDEDEDDDRSRRRRPRDDDDEDDRPRRKVRAEQDDDDDDRPRRRRRDEDDEEDRPRRRR